MCYCPTSPALLFRQCFLKPGEQVLELCPELSNLFDASPLLQLILPILVQLSNGSFLRVISRCFCIIVPGGFEVGDLLGSDRNRAIGRNSVVDREITTRIERG